MASSSGSNAHNHGSNGNNNNNVRMSSRSHQEDLDSFLTTIESKLRGPFSSLDLAKAVSTTALKGGNVPSATGSGAGGTLTSSLSSSSSSSKLAGAAAAKAYLQSLSQVLSRPDKVIQCRMLIGLLGLAPDDDSSGSGNGNGNKVGYDPSTSLTPEIYQILQETQVAPLHDEWVRTTSGLIQGIMFRKWHQADGHDNNNSNDDDENDDDDARESCRGDEAAKIIATTAGSDVTDIVEREIRREVTAHGNGKPEDLPPDLNACYAPYRYRLVSTPVLAAIIPEFHYSPDATKGRATGSAEDGTQNEENDEDDDDHDDDHDGPYPDHTNCHFRVSTRPNILQIDEQLEEQRAKEALHHTFGGTASSTGGGGTDKGRAVNNKGSDNGNDKTSHTNGGVSVAATTTFPPGFRRTQLVKTVKDANGKTSSMFMPKGKGGGPGGTASTLFNTSTKHRPVPTKTLLRKKGGAQALVSRSTMKGRLTGMGPTGQGGVGSAVVATGGVTSPSAAGGAAGPSAGTVTSATTTSSSSPTTTAASASLLPSSSLADKLAARRAEGRTYGGRGGGATTTNKGRSKMMMLDMNEADTLQQKQRSVEEDQQTSRLSKKRRILEMAKQKAGLTTTTTPTSTKSSGAPGHGAKNGSDSGKGGGPKNGIASALSSPPNKRAKSSASTSSTTRGQQQQPPAENKGAATAAATGAPSSTSSSPNHTDDGWESLLGGRSNKISDEDRVRLQQFFENRRHNPYPDQPNVYKMKVHEQRGEDPETKQPIKETFYLELDYDEGKVQQLRKVKRY